MSLDLIVKEKGTSVASRSETREFQQVPRIVNFKAQKHNIILVGNAFFTPHRVPSQTKRAQTKATDLCHTE